MELMYPFTGVSTLANPSFSPKDRVGHIEIGGTRFYSLIAFSVSRVLKRAAFRLRLI